MRPYQIILLLLALYGCSPKAGDEERSAAPKSVQPISLAVLTEEQVRNGEIEVEEPLREPISELLKLNGKIDVPPQNMVSISAPLGGYLKSTNLLPGTRVQKGEVLAVLEDQQYIQLQQEYLMGVSRLLYLEKEFKRQKELNNTQAASDKVAQLAEADYQGQRVTNRALYEKLTLAGINPDKLSLNHISKSIRILSPINGFVSKVNVNIGKYISPTEVLFELVNPNDIHLNLKIFERDLGKIEVGQKIQAYTNSNPNKKYACEVLLVGKDFSAERTTEVHAHFEQYDHSLLPGMYMNAEMELGAELSVTVPQDAVVSFENQTYVFVPEEKGSYRMTEVKTGASERGRIAIISPDLTGQQVVVKGAYALLMFLKNESEE